MSSRPFVIPHNDDDYDDDDDDDIDDVDDDHADDYIVNDGSLMAYGPNKGHGGLKRRSRAK